MEFEGDEAILHFPNSGVRRVSLDDEEMDDPTSISAFDYKTGTYWDIDIGDCEGSGGSGQRRASSRSPSRVAIQKLVPLYVNGKAAGSAILATNGRVYLPVRLVAENLEATVNWNALKQQVEIVSGSDTIVLSLGSKSAMVNGVRRDFDSVLPVDIRAALERHYLCRLGGVCVDGDRPRVRRVDALELDHWLRDLGTLLVTPMRWDTARQAVYVGR